ncbi:hypothetical protein RRG08_017152 [Elysia crispata]|uniref:Uncharacterized protein n=1 Tax=Elysia crispata TaxID=231223 RepID=A0AAE1B425_9GAST|nr:hypothetical protein RRG08_017152 [Elysia crispata]
MRELQACSDIVIFCYLIAGFPALKYSSHQTQATSHKVSITVFIQVRKCSPPCIGHDVLSPAETGQDSLEPRLCGLSNFYSSATNNDFRILNLLKLDPHRASPKSHWFSHFSVKDPSGKVQEIC